MLSSWLTRLLRLTSKSLPTAGYKMVIVVRTDIPMSKGKVGSQCAHAALECYRKGLTSFSAKQQVRNWLYLGQPKIILRVNGEQELITLAHQAQRAGLVAALIKDAGHTQVQPGTTTVLGIGPGPVEVVDSVTANLRLL